MFKTSTIYVAGHTGLLGTALIKKISAAGYSNIITRTHRELDLANQTATQDFFEREHPEYVFLAAGLTGGINANKTRPADFLHTNVAIQDNVFQAANKHNVKHIVFYGSSCIYPRNSLQPIKEEYMLTGEIERTSEAYAAAKIAGIIGCRAYNAQFNTNRFIAMVPNSMYGTNDNFDPDNSHVLAALINKFHTAKINKQDRVTLWGSGNPRREFIYSEDVAEASIFAVLNADKLKNSHYNIGTGTDYSIREIAGIISEIIGFNGTIEWDEDKPDGAPKKLLDSSMFLNLGWRPSTGLEKGLETTYKWYCENMGKGEAAIHDIR